MIAYNISRPKTANFFGRAPAIHGGITQSPGNVARFHATQKSITILRERFVAILGLPSLIGNTAVKKRSLRSLDGAKVRCLFTFRGNGAAVNYFAKTFDADAIGFISREVNTVQTAA